MEYGYFKIYRQLFEKPIWQSSTPEQKAILITLLAMANHTQKEWEWNGEKYICNPGQFITSLDGIVKKCGKGITKQNVRTSLVRFEKLNFLTNESTKTGRLITIVNWGIYQAEENKANNDTNKDLTKSQHRPNIELTPNKNDKNNKNDKKYINTCANAQAQTGFDEFWKSYPKKRSKGDAEKAFTKLNPSRELLTKMLNALEQAKTCKDWARDNGQFVPYPATWIRAKGWEDDYSDQESSTAGLNLEEEIQRRIEEERMLLNG